MIPPSSDGDVFGLQDWREVTIHATGATLIFDPSHCPVHIQHCGNVTWDGGTLRFSRPAFRQGKVTASGSDDKGSYFDWQLDAGYPTARDNNCPWLNVVDGKTGGLKVRANDFFTERDGGTSATACCGYAMGRTAATPSRWATTWWAVRPGAGTSSTWTARRTARCTT
ncbi:MAG: hypothetical protein WDO13_21470 [Verrucomicrobiota bacterium]